MICISCCAERQEERLKNHSRDLSLVSQTAFGTVLFDTARFLILRAVFVCFEVGCCFSLRVNSIHAH